MSENPLEMQAFIDKMEWEGGVTGMLAYGGPGTFPAELQDAANRAKVALDEIEAAIEAYENETQTFTKEQ